MDNETTIDNVAETERMISMVSRIARGADEGTSERAMACLSFEALLGLLDALSIARLSMELASEA